MKSRVRYPSTHIRATCPGAPVLGGARIQEDGCDWLVRRGHLAELALGTAAASEGVTRTLATASWPVFSRSPSSGRVRRDFRTPRPANYSEEERGLSNK